MKTGLLGGITLKGLSRKEFLNFVLGPIIVGILLLIAIGYGFYSLFYLLHALSSILKRL